MSWTSRFLSVSLLFALLLAGCDSVDNNDDEPETNRFRVEITNVQDQTQGAPFPMLKSGVFNTRAGSGEQGPIRPGEAYEISFTAGPEELPGVGAQFSFITMFIQSNDLFYAFEPGGIALFTDGGTPIGATSPEDVTGQLALWDAGTEVDQEPGTGTDQAPRQDGVDTGASEGGSIVRVEDTDGDSRLEDSGFEYPPVSDVVNVTVQSEEDAETGSVRFTVRIENVSDETGATANGAPIPLSPGTYAVHFDTTPGGEDVGYFPVGSAAPAGIEDIAEDGAPSIHAETLADLTGVTVPLSPGAMAVHTSDVQFFTTGEPAGAGIEGIAEDGVPTALAEALAGIDGVRSSGAFGVDRGLSETTGPIAPGSSYAFEIEASPGDRLSFATMYIQSNDLFYAFDPAGLPLFNGETPVGGDVTSNLGLWDAGTEGDEEPGAGLNQAPRQPELDVGPDGEGSIQNVAGSNDGFSYPAVQDIIRVEITPL